MYPPVAPPDIGYAPPAITAPPITCWPIVPVDPPAAISPITADGGCMPTFSLYLAVFIPVGTGDCIIIPPPGVCTTLPMWSTMCGWP